MQSTGRIAVTAAVHHTNDAFDAIKEKRLIVQPQAHNHACVQYKVLLATVFYM
jgi:hypothetical protein